MLYRTSHGFTPPAILYITSQNPTSLYTHRLLYYATQYFKVRYCTKPAIQNCTLHYCTLLDITRYSPHYYTALHIEPHYNTRLHNACSTIRYLTQPQYTTHHLLNSTIPNHNILHLTILYLLYFTQLHSTMPYSTSLCQSILIRLRMIIFLVFLVTLNIYLLPLLNHHKLYLITFGICQRQKQLFLYVDILGFSLYLQKL